MSDAAPMVQTCHRHQHPEDFGGRAVDTACSAETARAIFAMAANRAHGLTPSIQAQIDRLLSRCTLE